jgi:hypothetical protein
VSKLIEFGVISCEIIDNFLYFLEVFLFKE